MNAAARKIRGILGIGTTWSVACAAIFASLWTLTAIFDPGSIDPGEGVLRIVRIGATLGFVSGASFAALLAFADRRKSLQDVTIKRAALWGAIGAAAFPLFTTANNSMLLIVCPIGAALAAGSLMVARHAALAATDETLLNATSSKGAIAGEH